MSPELVLQFHLFDDEQAATGLTRDWFNDFDGCKPDDRADKAAENPGVVFQCDEFPNYRMAFAGPPQASILLIPRQDNAREGAFFGNFLNNPTCGDAIKGEQGRIDERVPFLVIPAPAVRTSSFCGTLRN